MTRVALATEDELSEAVGARLLDEAGLSVGLRLRRKGLGYLRSNMDRWRGMVENGVPLLILADLDRVPCPAALISDWCGKRALPARLLLRVVAREIEAWLLADHVAVRGLLGVKAKVPLQPDTLPDPKAALLALAKAAPRLIRDDLVAAEGAAAGQGLGYNNRLCAFVREDWSPSRASKQSPSLQRARRRLLDLAADLNGTTLPKRSSV